MQRFRGSSVLWVRASGAVSRRESESVRRRYKETEIELLCKEVGIGLESLSESFISAFREERSGHAFPFVCFEGGIDDGCG